MIPDRGQMTWGMALAGWIIGFVGAVALGGNTVAIATKTIDPRTHQAYVELAGKTFGVKLDTDWSAFEPERGACPREWSFMGKPFKQVRFGFNEHWNWTMDLDVRMTDQGVVALSQGYREIRGGRIPFMQVVRFFWSDPEMLYEVSESRHLNQNDYVVGLEGDGDRARWLPEMRALVYEREGVTVCWQFSPMPVNVRHDQGRGWICTFDGSRVETLVTWGRSESYHLRPFESISPALQTVEVVNRAGEKRSLILAEKHRCLEPEDRLVWPGEDAIVTHVLSRAEGTAVIDRGLCDFSVRQATPERLALGSGRVFSMAVLAQSDTSPLIKDFLVRAMRSFVERRIFNVVPEDDPREEYLWGTGTWPRCFSVLSLDYFGFHQEAYAYLEFMLDISRQFAYRDQCAHLWDSFYMTGQRREIYCDINGHSIKLYEAGLFYMNHRRDERGQMLLREHYETLRQWCAWIEKNMHDNGLIYDRTEANIWSYGYGVFTQAPAAAGVKLFLTMAADNGKPEDAAHFQVVLKRLQAGLDLLYGDAGNSEIGVPEGVGNCFLTFLPWAKMEPGRKGLGLSCYSLAPNFFLLEPQVGLLSKDDPRIIATLDLALKYLGDKNDPRIITWHVRNNLAHIGYGQGQLLMALIYAQRPEEFRARLQALFEITQAALGDKYLILEVLGRPDVPNKGNKAHLSYYPVIVAHLAGISHDQGILKDFIPDMVVKRR